MDKTLQTKFILARYRKIEEGLRQTAWRGCLLLAQSGPTESSATAALLGAKRTSAGDWRTIAIL
jgi:hypothetical protein